MPKEMHDKISKIKNCDGCGIKLQFFEKKALGFVEYNIFKSFIENQIAFDQNKKEQIESLIYDKTLLNEHLKLPAKKDLKVKYLTFKKFDIIFI